MVYEIHPSDSTPKWKCLSGLSLKILALFFMFCDHAHYTIAGNWEWLAVVGRLAFPIFAFQVAEGFAYTRDRKKYRRRMLLFALISEIPFNLLVEGGPIFPFHQNVMFTFWLALWALEGIEHFKTKGTMPFIIGTVAILMVSYLVGFITFVDYYGYGIWTVILFWLCRNMKWGWIPELIVLIYLNCMVMGGMQYPVQLFGRLWEIPQQGFAVLAMIPICLYNGKRGFQSKAVQYGCYAFYPLHMLVLSLLATVL